MAQLEAVTSENDERLPRLATASFVALLAAPDKTALHVATVSVFLRVTTGNREKKVASLLLSPNKDTTSAAIAPISAALSARALWPGRYLPCRRSTTHATPLTRTNS